MGTRQGCPVDSGQQSTVDAGSRTIGGRATGRVSKRQWLDEAFDMLASDGVDSLRITHLAKRLDISKSGFYWHFEDREDLLKQMKTFWVDEFSQSIISEIQAMEGPLKSRLRCLAQTIRERQAGQYDLVFALWAKRDPEVRSLVDKVTEMRLTFLRGLLSDESLKKNEIEARARILLVYFAWSEVMFRQTPDGLEGEPLEDILEIIAGTAEP
jgi:AcrR family transcriptional regulator